MDYITVEHLTDEIRRAVEWAAPDHDVVQIALWHERPAWVRHPQYGWIGTWLPNRSRVTTHRAGGGISYGGNVLSLVYDLENCRLDPVKVARRALVANVEYAVDTYAEPDEHLDNPDAELSDPPDWVLEGISRAFSEA